jgi:hypothetical protein
VNRSDKEFLPRTGLSQEYDIRVRARNSSGDIQHLLNSGARTYDNLARYFLRLRFAIALFQIVLRKGYASLHGKFEMIQSDRLQQVKQSLLLQRFHRVPTMP